MLKMGTWLLGVTVSSAFVLLSSHHSEGTSGSSKVTHFPFLAARRLLETHDGTSTEVTIYIVTEPVMPLSDKIKELGLKATQRYMGMSALRVLLLHLLWTGNSMLLMSYRSLMEAMNLQVDLCWYTIHFMDILNLKDSVEKDTFFRKLPNVAEQLPREIVLKKVLPLLASSLEFGSAVAPALTALLKMGSWLSTEDFKVKVLPTMVKLFASNDRAIRVSLLQHVDQFGESMSGQIVDEQVYPHVATGFADTSAFLRELTLKSMLVLAPKSFDYAFTVRALRDTFPPARGAGIVALCATSTTYDYTEIATRILPNVVVLTIDQDSEVRSKAFQAVEQFFQILKQNYEKKNSGETGGTVGASAIPETADGWGDVENGISEGHDSDKDGWDLDPIDEPKPAPALSNIQAAQKRPVSQTSRPPATSSRPKISTAKAAAKSEDDDLWGSIAAAPPATTSRPLNLKKAVQSDDEDLWAAISAPPPTTRAKPLSSGRGRAAKPAAPRLGAQRINRTSS
ncbi:hypothetical protein Bca52824_050199 [Brassica carinata]|uniref:Uncharacterized protein n=1 Tax=Brassica carinata TaxID=52824 RepID=A0A8X7USI2_BRACI|nr:hypothetical protein Bca52824_050199 [Brassica carinata]